MAIDYHGLKAFATLTPANAEAQDAFSRVVDSVRLDQSPGVPSSFSRFLHVNDEQAYNGDVARLRRGGERPVDEGDETATEPDTDTEQQPEWQQRGMVWSGCFYFTVGNLPMPGKRWSAGRLHDNVTILHFPLSVKPSSIRRLQATFGFCKITGCLQIHRPRKGLGISVNGVDVAQFSTFISGTKVMVHLGTLKYCFEYTPYSYTDAYYRDRDREIMQFTTSEPWIAEKWESLTRTPTQQPTTIKGWTLRTPVGRGAFGNVTQAINDQSHAVALKARRRKCRYTASQLSREIQTLQEITSLARQHNESRILQLREVLYQYGNEGYQDGTTEDVHLVLDPFLPFTVTHIINISQAYPLKSRLALRVLHEAMLGLQFLHLVGWRHGDIKPANIGIGMPHQLPSSQDDLQNVRVVLLDLDDATNLQALGPTHRLDPTPGHGGTRPYLAPERELEYQSYADDVWAMGVTGHELRYGQHPWKFSDNPWKPMGDGDLRKSWMSKYGKAMVEMQKDSIGKLLAKMLVFSLSSPRIDAPSPRITIDQALKEPCWALLNAYDQNLGSKKIKI